MLCEFWYFSRFLNCPSGNKSRQASHVHFGLQTRSRGVEVFFFWSLNTVFKQIDKMKIRRTEGLDIFYISNHFVTFTLSKRFHLSTVWGSGFSKSKVSTAEFESRQCNLLELANKM